GLLNLCTCSAWGLSVNGTPLVGSVENFTFTATGAVSTVRLHDPASGLDLRVVHDFHPVVGSTNLYQVLVTVYNLGTAPVDAVYTRTVAWSAGAPDPTTLGIDPLLGAV